MAYAFIAEEASHAATANEAVSAQTASLALSVADGAVTSAKLAPQSVTSQKISDLAVTQTKLADKSVTPSKLSDDALYTDDKAVSQIFRLFPSNHGAPITLNFAPAPNSSLRSSDMRRRHNPQN